MSRSVIETVLGGFVLLGAVIFLIFSYGKGDAGTVSGYKISANFAKIGGLKAGDPVQISGVKIGQIASVDLDPKTYLAKVTMEIDNAVKVPDDSAATISSQSLLGGMAMGIEPGGSDVMLEQGGGDPIYPSSTKSGRIAREVYFLDAGQGQKRRHFPT